MDRMTGHPDNDLVWRFLRGALEPDETDAFTAGLADDPSLRQRFREESAYEALFYSLSWETEESSRLEKDFGMTVPDFSAGTDLFSTAEWRSMVDSAFRAGNKRSADTGRRIFHFPSPVRYLAAACFIAGLAIAGFVVSSRFSPGDKTRMIVASHRDFGGLEEVRTGASTGPRPIVFDSIIIYQAEGFAGKPLLTNNKNGIVRIGEKTAILLDTNSSVAVISRTDSAVAVSLRRGSALFTVEKGRYRGFSVATPSCDIAVTGTVFRLAVTGDTTIVSVLEGSVLARHRGDTAAIAVIAGTSARIGPDAVRREEGDTAATLLYRSNLLRDFLKENGIWENGRFIRSGIGGGRQ
jgi:hypothetical protein